MVIALVNKVPIYRSGMAFFLKDELPEGTIIVESESVSSLKWIDTVGNIDLVIMAIEQMPDMLIVPSILEVKKNYPSTKLIVVGKGTDPSSVINYFSIGVLGYVDNGSALSELVKCVESVSTGKKFVSLDLLWMLAKGVRSQVDLGETRLVLTGREYRIARCLCEGKRVTWIANELNLKPSTVSTVKATIFKKLGVSDIIKLRDRIDDMDRLSGDLSTRRILGS